MPSDVILPASCTSRPRAALARLRRASSLLALTILLASCASDGLSPLGDSVQGLLPGKNPVAERAEALPYASLILDTGDRVGLVVMGAQAGDTTLWPTGNRGLLTLYREGLQATAGLPRNLLDTRYRPAADSDAPQAGYVPWRKATPATFRVERSWQETDGAVTRLSANGQLECQAPKPRKLPLASLPLERCEQRLAWDDGRVTTGTLWREAESRRLWAHDETPWPGGPRVSWEVARPWW